MAQGVTYDNMGQIVYQDDDEQQRQQQTQQGQPAGTPFDASRVPNGVPVDWAEDFLNRNPGDYHRIGEAFNSKGGGGAVKYASPTEAWNSQPQENTGQNELYALLMDRAKQGTSVNRMDANVRQQVDPVVAQQTRANRNELDAIAEKAGPLANLTGERRLMAERTGQFAGALESEVIGREIGARRDEIAQALSLYGNLLSADKRMELERELAYLNDRARTADRGLQAQGLAQNNDQFLRELALREWDTTNAWDYRWAGLGV